MKDILGAFLLICVIAFPFGVYVVAMRHMFSEVPHMKAARKSARSSNYGRAHKKLFDLHFSMKERNVKWCLTDALTRH